ncbi:MAG: carboxypeptidase-like regulatory domain-containing protein [Saonia sp.]
MSGTVIDVKNDPIIGANIYLEGTYDGASSDEYGKFSFETPEKVTRSPVVSMISFVTYMQVGDVFCLQGLNIQSLFHPSLLPFTNHLKEFCLLGPTLLSPHTNAAFPPQP